MTRKNLEKCENFSFLTDVKMRYLDVSNMILFRKEKTFSKALKISFKGRKGDMKKNDDNLWEYA